MNIFEGRTTRCNMFFSTILYNFVLGFVCSIISYETEYYSNVFLGVVFIFFSLFSILYASVLVRRCHDVNLSGWYGLLFRIIPIAIWYLVLKDGDSGPNKYGDDPKRRVLNDGVLQIVCPVCGGSVYLMQSEREFICPHCNEEFEVDNE